MKLVNEVIDGLAKSCTACSPTCQFVAHLLSNCPKLGFEELPSIASLEEIAEEVLERVTNSCTGQSPACYTLNAYVPHAGMQ